MVSFHSFDCMWHVAIWHVGGIPCCASYVDASLGGKCLGKCSFCYIFSIFSIKFKSTDFTSAIYFLYISHFYLEQLQQYKQIFNIHSNAVKKQMSFQEWDARCYINFTMNTELKHTSKCSRILKGKMWTGKKKKWISWIFAVRYEDFVGNWNEH